jgi:hypothetical protein
MTAQNILELPRLFESSVIRGWSSNSLEINILELYSRGFMMQLLMGGAQRIFIDVAISRDGR